MSMTHLTGANCQIKIGGTTWADADFSFGLSQAKASHARTGKKSDINYPGKLTATITCKNIMRSAYYMGNQITPTAINGSAGTIKAGVTLTADGYTASTTPAITTPSQVSLTVVTAAVTTPGYITVIGLGPTSLPLEEDIYVTTLGIGASVTGTKLFSSVTGVYNTAVRSATGTLTVASVAGANYYTISTTTPTLFTLLMQGTDDAGNFVKVQATHCWISSSAFKSGDSNSVLEDAVSFEVTDLDADLQIWDATSS